MFMLWRLLCVLVYCFPHPFSVWYSQWHCFGTLMCLPLPFQVCNWRQSLRLLQSWCSSTTRATPPSAAPWMASVHACVWEKERRKAIKPSVKHTHSFALSLTCHTIAIHGRVWAVDGESRAHDWPCVGRGGVCVERAERWVGLLFSACVWWFIGITVDLWIVITAKVTV